MNAFSRLLILAALVALLGGCATPFRAPPDVAHFELARADSTAVRVDKLWLERDHGRLVVRGYVQRRIEADDTTHTHLDVTLVDASGQPLRNIVAAFTPRDIPPRNRRPVLASYRVPLEPLPSAVSRIEVRAHDGEMH